MAKKDKKKNLSLEEKTAEIQTGSAFGQAGAAPTLAGAQKTYNTVAAFFQKFGEESNGLFSVTGTGSQVHIRWEDNFEKGLFIAFGNSSKNDTELRVAPSMVSVHDFNQFYPMSGRGNSLPEEKNYSSINKVWLTSNPQKDAEAVINAVIANLKRRISSPLVDSALKAMAYTPAADTSYQQKKVSQGFVRTLDSGW